MLNFYLHCNHSVNNFRESSLLWRLLLPAKGPFYCNSGNVQPPYPSRQTLCPELPVWSTVKWKYCGASWILMRTAHERERRLFPRDIYQSCKFLTMELHVGDLGRTTVWKREKQTFRSRRLCTEPLQWPHVESAVVPGKYCQIHCTMGALS